MKRIIKLFIIASMSCSCGVAIGDTEIELVDRPDVSIVNSNYIGNRQPLKPLNFIKLPVGAIQPEGWLKKYLLLQKEGLTGKLGEISAWLEKEDNAWLTKGGSHGWEEVPYWLKGYGNLAYILNDSSMLKETKLWINAMLASQQENGYFGTQNIVRGNPELWSNMIALWCLQSYYEYSNDSRVIDLMTGYFKWQMTVPDSQLLEDYWENSRGGDNLYSIFWLYNITGEPFLLELAEKIHRNTADWTGDSYLPNWHNVNVAQCFREPATYYMLSGDSAHLRASYNDYYLIRRIFGQVPGGMFGADENARMGYIDPRQGTETCGFVEQMASDEILLRITGDPLWAANCENVAFNSYPAAVMPDFKALRYITAPNQAISDSENHHPGIDNRGPFLAMNPFSSRCCQHNHAQGWPYYTENLVFASPDNGMAIALYGACSAKVTTGKNGVPVVLTEETNYPFEETVRFRFNMSETVEFPFYLLIPSWCNGASLKINNTQIKKELIAGKYVKIERKWKDGDFVDIHLPMHLSVSEWATNRNSVSLNYGPLTFSLLIKEEYKKVNSKETAIGDSQWQKDADPEAWPSYELYPASPWNYALYINEKDLNGSFRIVKRAWLGDNFPFTQESVPITVEAKGRRIPSWTIDKYGLTAVLPEENAVQSDALENITLIPMGAARLRISSFPKAKD